MKKLFLTLTLTCIFVFFVGCTNREGSPEEVEQEATEQTDDESPTEEMVLAGNLKIPWSIEKAEDVFYITEREGTIVKIENGEVKQQEVELEQTISSEAEAGLLGLVLDPYFEDNQRAFVYYTYEGESGPTNRIIQLQLEGNTWTETAILLDGIPSGNVHHGGRLAIGPDDKLYATTGDAASPDLAQELDSLAGKILRMNLDGSIPEDNPFENSYIYSYGHRNPQGLTWLEDGTLYASEHGDRANDEINRIEAGENYGWPVIEGTEETDDMRAPAFTSGNEDTWAPSGMASKEDTLYVAALRGQAILIVDLETNEIRKILTDYGRIRDVYIENDFLYAITNNTDGRGNPIDTDDRLIRLELE